MHAVVIMFIEDTKGIGDGIHHRLGDLLSSLVTAQHAAAVRSEVKVYKGFDCQVSWEEITVFGVRCDQDNSPSSLVPVWREKSGLTLTGPTPRPCWAV